MTEAELLEREKQLDVRENNLKSMMGIAMMEHLTQTQTIEKVSRKVADDLTKEGHVCFQGERLAKIETKLDIVIKNQEDDKGSSKRIDKIETIGKGIILVIIASWAIFVWLFEKVSWK